MGTKRSVGNICAVGIIHRAASPGKVFLEFKTPGYTPLFVNHLCLVGGNWFGEGAKGDMNPLATFRREVEEELSYDHPIQSVVELRQLGNPDAEPYSTEPVTKPPTEDDRRVLARLIATIRGSATHFGDYVIRTRAEAFSDGRKNDSVGLSSYFSCALEEADWQELVHLQRTYGNLSNESITVATSLEEIIREGTRTSWGHDWPLVDFWRSRGLEVKGYPFFPGTCAERMEHGLLNTYADYETLYDVAKTPFKIPPKP